MRVIIFLSRFTFICNIAFLLFVFFRWIESQKHVQAGSNRALIPIPFLENIIIVLGFSAIVINVLMNIFYFIFLIRGKMKRFPMWLVLVNFIFLIIQIFYFFL